jgi:hypothetical protein
MVRFRNRGGLSLAPVTDYATESIHWVRNYGMLPKRLLIDIRKTRFLQPQVARGAAVNDAKFRQPDLMDARLEAPAQTDGISAIVDQRKVFALKAMPLAEMLLRRRNCQRQQ